MDGPYILRSETLVQTLALSRKFLLNNSLLYTLSRCSECSGWVEPRQSAVCEGKQQWRLFWNSSQVLSFCSLKMSKIYDLIRYQIVPPIFLLGFPIVTQVSKQNSKQYVVHLFTYRIIGGLFDTRWNWRSPYLFDVEFVHTEFVSKIKM